MVNSILFQCRQLLHHYISSKHTHYIQIAFFNVLFPFNCFRCHLLCLPLSFCNGNNVWIHIISSVFHHKVFSRFTLNAMHFVFHSICQFLINSFLMSEKAITTNILMFKWEEKIVKNHRQIYVVYNNIHKIFPLFSNFRFQTYYRCFESFWHIS